MLYRKTEDRGLGVGREILEPGAWIGDRVTACGMEHKHGRCPARVLGRGWCTWGNVKIMT